MTDRENWRHIAGHFYIVRTQAGLKHAIRHFAGEQTSMEVKGYPRAYPALVALSTGYSGANWIRVQALPVNQAIAAITESDKVTS